MRTLSGGWPLGEWCFFSPRRLRNLDTPLIGIARPGLCHCSMQVRMAGRQAPERWSVGLFRVLGFAACCCVGFGGRIYWVGQLNMYSQEQDG